ncbi:MAG TPA: hypothetical protein PKI03_08125 [Pseudomonadota bacterium]|nr:hypothetical protein [Pseudomonadota bacterium]
MNIRRLVLLALALSLPSFTPAATLPQTPAAELRALHEKVMRAHRQSNVELLLEDEAEDNVVANRGEISRPTLKARRERLGAYLKATTFSEYKDSVDPVVSVSADATQGWVIAQVSARGKQRTEKGDEVPLQFVSAWIELYEKRGGKWQRTGNVSNFKP